jgi:hypothetical protein
LLVWSESEPITVHTPLWSSDFNVIGRAEMIRQKPYGETQVMPIKLNRKAFEHAKALVLEGKFVYHQRDDWSEHQPSAEEKNEFIRLHGFSEYAKWYLAKALFELLQSQRWLL